MAMFQHLQYERKGSSVCITLDRPAALNALSQELLLELDRAVDLAGADANVSGVILTGRDKAFAAGADIVDLAAADALQAGRFSSFGQRLFDKIEALGKPVIAAVNGVAFGGGCELAMACTLRIASENARFSQPEVRLGVIPGFGGTQRLPRLVGRGCAMRLVLTGEVITAQDALGMGLVNEVVGAEHLLARAEQLLLQICANAPIAIRLAMEAMYRGGEASLADGLALERALFSICAGTQDKREGTSAFLAKRAPQFKGE